MPAFRYGTQRTSTVGDPMRVVEAYLAGREYSRKAAREPLETRKLGAETETAEAELEKVRFLMSLIRAEMARMGGGGPGAAPGAVPGPAPSRAQPVPGAVPGQGPITLPEAGPAPPQPFPAGTPPVPRAAGGASFQSPLLRALLKIPQADPLKDWLAAQSPEVQEQAAGREYGMIPKAGETGRMAIDVAQHKERMDFERQKQAQDVARRAQEFNLKQQEFIAAMMDRDAKRADSALRDMVDFQVKFAELGPGYAGMFLPAIEQAKRLRQSLTGREEPVKPTVPKAPKKELEEVMKAEVEKLYLADPFFRETLDLYTKSKRNEDRQTLVNIIVPRLRAAGIDASVEETGTILGRIGRSLIGKEEPVTIKVKPPGAAAPAAPPAAMQTMPPASEHKGRVIRDTVTGKRHRSDGKTWQEIK